MALATIIWDVNPEAFSIGFITVRWYGLLYAMGFLLGITILGKIFKRENCPEDWADKVFIYMVLAVVIGARLGHVFFYAWDYYKDNLLEIVMIWHGGLASHGGAIAMLIAAWIFSKKVSKKSFLWLGDRLFIPSAMVAGLIRIGNLMNSEIYGHATDLPWGFVFVRDGGTMPMHPTQIYEALAYFALFAFMMYLYWVKDAQKREGLLTGVGFTGIFVARFFIEFVKNNQEAFEDDLMLNMGQYLSIPFIAIGIWLIIRALRSNKI
ncbi:MAG TPA: prolipoprotein diacylglyceryl transferase [Paludibacteraceae bacterium]|mgnify:FL=1|nr:prolipoprotein diacylglyceryl transferase [Paludibacteraceae bacterium]HOH74360.1 prolipoprotein diacylglyceryl transferase [Paludibacteraceae bacterium]HOU27405.1 prolipoprotein diacylglyceryl transferase [Paludibacteraceae bacterium]